MHRMPQARVKRPTPAACTGGCKWCPQGATGPDLRGCGHAVWAYGEASNAPNRRSGKWGSSPVSTAPTCIVRLLAAPRCMCMATPQAGNGRCCQRGRLCRVLCGADGAILEWGAGIAGQPTSLVGPSHSCPSCHPPRTQVHYEPRPPFFHANSAPFFAW